MAAPNLLQRLTHAGIRQDIREAQSSNDAPFKVVLRQLEDLRTVVDETSKSIAIWLLNLCSRDDLPKYPPIGELAERRFRDLVDPRRSARWYVSSGYRESPPTTARNPP